MSCGGWWSRPRSSREEEKNMQSSNEGDYSPTTSPRNGRYAYPGPAMNNEMIKNDRAAKQSEPGIPSFLDMLVERPCPYGMFDEDCPGLDASCLTDVDVFLPLSMWGYLLFDRYSPLHLEADEHMSRRVPWRAAFEDLLLASDQCEMRAMGYEEGIEWPLDWAVRMLRASDSDIYRMCHVAETATKPSLLDMVDPHAFRSSASARTNKNHQDEPETELDHYARSVGTLSGMPGPAPPASSPSIRPRSSAVSPQDILLKPSLVSTFTTTKRTTDPDGTVHTRTVLRQRFADGSEESTETVHADHVGTASSSDSTRARALGFDRMLNGGAKEMTGTVPSSAQKEKERPRGWFWRA